MNNKIKLLPGIPDDDNRHFLPEELKESEIVVNENGNNSQVYPKNLKEYRACLIDDNEDTWYEYVPDSYDPGRKTPLVISMHGGLMTGWGQCVYTSWTLVADREGFIVVYPNAHSRNFWQVEYEKDACEEISKPNEAGLYMHDFPEDIRENNDARIALKLIDLMKEKYNIDEERIYMQGMSLGNHMTAMMARHYGYRFAAVAGSAGTATEGLIFDKNNQPINEGGPVPVWQARMEYDIAPFGSSLPVEEVVVRNREYWLRVNECGSLPRLKIDGEHNYAFYRGKKADFVFCDVAGRDHGQTFDDAELAWDYLFSGIRRLADGTIKYTAPELPREGDKKAIAAADGCTCIWINGEKRELPAPALLWRKLKYHGVEGDPVVRGEYCMIPLRFIADLSAQEYEECGGWAEMKLEDGRVLQFAKGCIGCTIDNRVRSMLCEPIERNGMLYISIEWFCQEILQMHVSTSGNVMYATDHYSRLSVNMAWLIRDLLR